MRRTSWLLFIFFFCSGILVFLVRSTVLIVSFSLPYTKSSSCANVVPSEEQTATLYYFKDAKWCQESVAVVWNDAFLGSSLKLLINKWLFLLHDEQILFEHCFVDHIALSCTNGELFISFASLLLKPSWSIDKKWKIIEALLKTIRMAAKNIQVVHFLVRQKPMIDDHLDFSFGWPVGGFFEDNTAQ